MAREKMVTRTIVRTNVKAMFVDIANKSVLESSFVLTGEYDEKSALKELEKIVDTNAIKPVSIISMEKEEILFGMSEQDFVTFGHVMESRTKTSD